MKIILIFLAALLSFLVPTHAVDSAQEKEIVVIFRLDDYSERSNTDMELRIIETFRQQGVPMTISVIPAPLADPSAGVKARGPAILGKKKAGILKEGYAEGLIDVALHGFSHEAYSTPDLGEFVLLDYDNQKERIMRGRQLLQKSTRVPVTSFVPPWNKYDDNTLKALAALRFKTFSASLFNEADLHPGLSYLPATCELAKLKKAVEAARGSSEERPHVVVLFHSYDFIEAGEGRGTVRLEELREGLAWLKKQPDVEFSTISREGEKRRNAPAHKMELNGEISEILDYLPFDWLHNHHYYSSSDSRYYYAWLNVGLFYPLLFLAATALSVPVARHIYGKSQFLFTLSKQSSTLLFIAIIIYALHDLDIHAKGLVACTVTFGMASGVWLTGFYARRQTDVNDGREAEVVKK